jgi:acyl-CoA synthetase (NDP forming)
VSFFAPPAISDELARIVAKHKKRTLNKPILAFTLYGQFTNEYLKIFDDHSVSAFSSTRRVIRALSVLRERGGYLIQVKEKEEHAGNPISKEALLNIEKLLDKAKGDMVDEYHSKKIMEHVGFHIPKNYYFNPGVKELIKDFHLEFPVVLKICSEGIAHKTELGGVKVGIKDLDHLKKEITEMAKRIPNEHMLVEEMEKGDVEMIFGGLKDGDFGMNVMVGMGGIYTEVFRDVAFRPAPITKTEADRMMSELKTDKIFRGFRGKKYPREKLIDMIVRFSYLLDHFKERISQIDLNPIFVSEDNLTVLDAKIFLKK